MIDLPTQAHAPKKNVACYLFAFLHPTNPYQIARYDLLSDPHPTCINSLPIEVHVLYGSSFEEAHAAMLEFLKNEPMFHPVFKKLTT